MNIVIKVPSNAVRSVEAMHLLQDNGFMLQDNSSGVMTFEGEVETAFGVTCLTEQLNTLFVTVEFERERRRSDTDV